MNISPLVVIVRDPGSPLSARLGSFVDGLTQTGGLDRLFETDRLIVAGQRTAAHLVLPDGAGLIWGRLFERMTSWRITDEDGLRNASAPFEQFVERYWGGYLAIRELGGIVEILRDTRSPAARYSVGRCCPVERARSATAIRTGIFSGP